VKRVLAASGDTRTVVADLRARDFGAALDDRGLNPGNNPRVGPTRFTDWLGRSVGQGSWGAPNSVAIRNDHPRAPGGAVVNSQGRKALER
jgi:hypothetical protein